VALTLTRDPAAFATVTVVGRLPWLLFALTAGALADRLDRRRTMTLVNAARSVVIGVLALVIALDVEALWMLYVIAFVLGVGETLFDTAAQSILPNVVDAQQLDRANGRLYAAETVTNQFLGPPLGAFVAGLVLAAAVAGSAGLYLAASLVLLGVSGSFTTSRTGPRTRIRDDVREGLRYLAGHRLLRVLAVCVGVSNLASSIAIAIAPLYMIEPGPVGLSEFGYGAVLTSLAAGSVLGTFAIDRIHRAIGTRRTLLLSVSSFSVFPLVPALTTSVALIVIAFVAFGTISIAWNVVTVSLRQRIVPDHMLGRLNASYRLVAWGTMPIGAAIGGLTADQLGLRPTLVVSAVISALCLPIVLFGVPGERLAEAERDGNSEGVATDLDH
jgi:MFS family permease